jgi:hypothetical protein
MPLPRLTIKYNGDVKRPHGNCRSATGDLSLRWRDGEPNKANNNEDCVVMTGTGEHNDVACTSVRHYFCRKESAKMTLNKCGTAALGQSWPTLDGIRDTYTARRALRSLKKCGTTTIGQS